MKMARTAKFKKFAELFLAQYDGQNTHPGKVAIKGFCGDISHHFSFNGNQDCSNALGFIFTVTRSQLLSSSYA